MTARVVERSLIVLMAVLALTACGDASTGDGPTVEVVASQDVSASEGPMATMIASFSLNPDEASAIPALADDADSLAALRNAVQAVDADAGQALGDVDVSTDLVIAVDLGECTVGTARVALDEDQLMVEGRESDGVCEAIDHEVQVWTVPWRGLPDTVQVQGQAATRP